MDIRVLDNTPEFLRSMEAHAKQVRFALAVALTKTAKAAERAEMAEIGRVFDRPKGTTIRSVRTKSATKADLEAYVAIKDWVGKGNAPDRYLRAQIFGGQRRAKRSERAIRTVYPWVTGYWVPGDGMKLDAYGNIPASTIVRILSDIQSAETMSGFAANRTARSVKRNKNYRGDRYFVPPPGSHLDSIAQGVWLRRKGRFREMVMPALVFVRATNYRRRFDFFGLGERFVRSHFPAEFDAALRMAFATAR